MAVAADRRPSLELQDRVANRQDVRRVLGEDEHLGGIGRVVVRDGGRAVQEHEHGQRSDDRDRHPPGATRRLPDRLEPDAGQEHQRQQRVEDQPRHPLAGPGVDDEAQRGVVDEEEPEERAPPQTDDRPEQGEEDDRELVGREGEEVVEPRLAAAVHGMLREPVVDALPDAVAQALRVHEEGREEQREDEREARRPPGPGVAADRTDRGHDRPAEGRKARAPAPHRLERDRAEEERARDEGGDVGRLLRREARGEEAEDRRRLPPLRALEEAEHERR